MPSYNGYGTASEIKELDRPATTQVNAVHISWTREAQGKKWLISLKANKQTDLGLCCWKILKEMEYQTAITASWETCMLVNKQQLEPDTEQLTSSKLGKEYDKAVTVTLLV